MLGKQVGKHTGVTTVVAAIFYLANQSDQLKGIMDNFQLHEFALAIGGIAALITATLGNIGLGRGDDPSSPKLAGVFTNGKNGN